MLGIRTVVDAGCRPLRQGHGDGGRKFEHGRIIGAALRF